MSNSKNINYKNMKKVLTTVKKAGSIYLVRDNEQK